AGGGRPPRFGVGLPPSRERRAADPQLAASCVPCPTVHASMHADARQRAALPPDAEFVYPPPARIGVELEAGDQALLASVRPGTPAARAGLAAGDRLLRVGEQPRVATIGDLSFALHRAAAGATRIPLTYVRDGVVRSAELELEAGWKRSPPDEYAWRPYKWNLSPAPGF